MLDNLVEVKMEPKNVIQDTAVTETVKTKCTKNIGLGLSTSYHPYSLTHCTFSLLSSPS
jgi:hypothetical protein